MEALNNIEIWVHDAKIEISHLMRDDDERRVEEAERNAEPCDLSGPHI